MVLTYDPKLNVAYIRFAEQSGEVDCHPINDEIVVDVGADGKVYGIELLNAREQLKTSNGKFQFINSLTQEHQEVTLLVP